MVNAVQFRVDFSPTGKYTVRERPVLIPDSLKLLFPHLSFASARLSTPDFTALFWDALRVEILKRGDGLLTKVPYHAIFLPDVFYYGGRTCFEDTVYTLVLTNWFEDDAFKNMLSAALLEATVRPAKQFSLLLPYDGEEVEQRINRRKYVGVMREAGSTDINVVVLDGNMKQYKMVFFTGFPRIPVTVIPQLPGFNLISRRLTEADKDELMQKPVLLHWTRPANRIEPVGSSLASFAQPAYVFEYNRAAVAARVDPVRLDAFACRRIQEGIAFVCSSGGPTCMLVPLQPELPPFGNVVTFLTINRDVRDVNVVYVELFNAGRTLLGYETIISPEFSNTLPLIRFTGGTVIPAEWQQSLVLDALHSVWTRRVDQLIVVEQPQVVVTGVTFDYLVTWPAHGAVRVQEGGIWRGLKSFNPIAAERTERVIRAMCADARVGSSLVPVPENRQNAFVAVIREGLNVRIGYISGMEYMRFIEPLRSLELVMPNLAYMPFVHGTPMDITPDITRTLFEQPIFSYWQQVAEINPHNWSPRAAAFGLAMQSRVGRDSPMRVLDAELVAAVAKLCLQ